MDPNATIKRITELFRDGLYAEAEDSAYDLLHWVDRGGFPPDGFTKQSAVLLAQVAISAAAFCGRIDIYG